MNDDARIIGPLLEGIRAGAGETGSRTGTEIADALERLLADRARLAAQVATLTSALQDCVQSIEDAYGGAAFVPGGTFEYEAAEKGRAALEAASQETT